MDALATFVDFECLGTVVFNGLLRVFLKMPTLLPVTYDFFKAASKVEFSVVGGGYPASLTSSGLRRTSPTSTDRWGGLY